MSEPPTHLPCWPCVKRTIHDASGLIRGAGGENLDKLLTVHCHGKGDLQDGKCSACCRAAGDCGGAPALLEGNAKDFVDTMAYVGMVINLNSPWKRDQRLWKEGFEYDENDQKGESPNEDFQIQDRVLDPKPRKDLVAATITLGARVIEIIEGHIETHGDGKEAGIRLLRRQDTIMQSSNEMQTSREGKLARLHNSAQPLRLDASNEEYLSWNTVAREFHGDILKALQPVNDHLARAIMENIPIKWIPAVDEEVLEAAKMVILKADLPAQF